MLKERIDYVPNYVDFYSRTKDYKGSIPFDKTEVMNDDQNFEEVNEVVNSLTDSEYNMYLEGLDLDQISDRTGRYYCQHRVQATSRLLQDKKN